MFISLQMEEVDGMRILILGVEGKLGRLVTDRVLKERQDQLVLFAGNRTTHLCISDPERQQIIDGDFEDEAALSEAMHQVDSVYLEDMSSPVAVDRVITAMKKTGVERIIGTTNLGVRDELIERFGFSYGQMIGSTSIDRQSVSAQLIEDSGLCYTLLRLTWLYSQAGNERYRVSPIGEPVTGDRVTYEAVARLVVDILADPSSFAHQNLGVSEPHSDWHTSMATISE
mgnify:CR=1 FL=1